MKNRIITTILTVVSAVALFFSLFSSAACYPFAYYQPKAPKSLLKED